MSGIEHQRTVCVMALTELLNELRVIDLDKTSFAEVHYRIQNVLLHKFVNSLYSTLAFTYALHNDGEFIEKLENAEHYLRIEWGRDDYENDKPNELRAIRALIVAYTEE